MKAKKKLAYGQNRMHIESPAEAMAENDIMMAKVEKEAAEDPWVIGTAMLGSFLMENAGSIAGSAVGSGGGGADTGSFSSDTDMFNAGVGGDLGVSDGTAYAKNGMKGGVGEVEVEGGEVFETQDGEAGEFQGASHAQGGIDVNLDKPTNVFSTKVFIDGDSAADRKKARLAQLAKLEKRMKDNPTDKLAKSTYARMKDNMDREEFRDLAAQQLVSSLMGSKAGEVGLKAEFGIMDWIGGLFSSDEENVEPNTIQDPNAPVQQQSGTGMGTSFGDMMSIGGNLFSGIAPLMNTLKQRATDTPNINAFEDFGQDALDANEEAQGFIAGQKSEALKDVRKQGQAQRSKTRNTSRSVNTMRAGDLATFSSETDATGDVYSKFAEQMMTVLGQKATLENAQDSAVMQGEKDRDLADRADKDAFYTAKGQDLATLGTSIQQTGKDLNEAKQQKAMKKILDQLSKYGITFDSDYNLQNPNQ